MNTMHLSLVSSLLRRGAALDKVSSLFTLLGLLFSLAPLLGLMINSWLALGGLVLLLLGIGEKYWALRVALDVDLFTALASSNDAELAGRDLDSALQQLALAPTKITERSLVSRSRGALRLLRYQALCLSGQVLMLLVASVIGCMQAFY